MRPISPLNPSYGLRLRERSREDLLGVWAPEEATRRRILVENPENLYGFAKSA